MTSRTAAPERGDPWGSHPLDDDAEATVRVGPLSIYLARTAGELRLAHSRTAVGAGTPPDPEADTADGAGPEGDPGHEGEAVELEWSRWAAGDRAASLTLSPGLPDRPLVVAPEEPFHLPASAEARIYVRVPLWVKVEMGGRKRTTLVNLPTIPASDTWWGSLEEGELGYWLTTHARRSVSDDLFASHLAMCPVQLVNRSEDDLTVVKIALRTAYLTLYRDGGRIWADETRVRYQGEAEGSHLDMADRPPREAPGATQLAEPTLRMARGFRARTFGRLRSIQEWMT
ncbi:MAG: hypothetical protein PVI57_11040 [Gemmatimonadota bacterium]|jgi:hypothetical protein